MDLTGNTTRATQSTCLRIGEPMPPRTLVTQDEQKRLAVNAAIHYISHKLTLQGTDPQDWEFF